jgi:hypothetical protein
MRSENIFAKQLSTFLGRTFEKEKGIRRLMQTGERSLMSGC